MPSSEESPVGFAPYRLDSHLILNALNNLGMEFYTQFGREIPAVGLLADYIIAEHGAGNQLSVARVMQPATAEWNVCKAMLSLKGALVGVRMDFREKGDLDGVLVPDHALAVLLRDIFSAWPKLAGHDVRLTLQSAGVQSLRLSAHLKVTSTTGIRQPFLTSLLNADNAAAQDIGALDVRVDDGYGWEIGIELPPVA